MQPKIQLSLLEIELVNNTEWILTKTGILKKVKHLLLALQEQQQECLQSPAVYFADEVLKTSPKISKGENYNGLPYFILDYPRLFDHHNIFAIRTMFWWGNFFSTTLHLSGKQKKLFLDKIITGYDLLKQNGFYICVHNEEWEHHFESYNYTEINKWNKDDFANKVTTSSFIKLAHKTPLGEWETVQDILFRQFKVLIDVLAI